MCAIHIRNIYNSFDHLVLQSDISKPVKSLQLEYIVFVDHGGILVQKQEDENFKRKIHKGLRSRLSIVGLCYCLRPALFCNNYKIMSKIPCLLQCL